MHVSCIGLIERIIFIHTCILYVLFNSSTHGGAKKLVWNAHKISLTIHGHVTFHKKGERENVHSRSKVISVFALLNCMLGLYVNEW